MEISGGEPSDSTLAMLAEFERRKRVKYLDCWTWGLSSHGNNELTISTAFITLVQLANLNSCL